MDIISILIFSLCAGILFYYYMITQELVQDAKFSYQLENDSQKILFLQKKTEELKQENQALQQTIASLESQRVTLQSSTTVDPVDELTNDDYTEQLQELKSTVGKMLEPLTTTAEIRRLATTVKAMPELRSTEMDTYIRQIQDLATDDPMDISSLRSVYAML